MNKKSLIVLSGLCVLFFLTVFHCAKAPFDSPLDKDGTSYAGDSAALDDNGNGIANYYDTASRWFNRDTVKPVITFKGGDTVIMMLNDPKQVLNQSGATAWDNNDRDISSKILYPEIFTSRCSTYNVFYRVSDAAGNLAEKRRTIIVDCEGPVITLRGPLDTTIMLNSIPVWTDPGFSARDNIDGPLPANRITVSGTVKTTVVGDDTVTYSASDRAGNLGTRQRYVHVFKPVIGDTLVLALLGANPITLTLDSAYKEPGYTAIDNLDGNLHDSVKITGTVNTHVAGTYILTYTVTSKAGTIARQTRTILVRQQSVDTLPLITLKGSGDTTIAVGSVWKDPGYTARDPKSGEDLTAKVVISELNNKQVNPINTLSPGTYTLLYNVKNKAGVSADQVARVVRVVGKSKDTIPPEIFLEGCTACSVAVGKPFTDPGYSARDNVDGIITADKIERVVTNNATGSVVPYTTFYQTMGTYKFTYTVSDAATNKATPAIRTVKVYDTFVDPSNLPKKYGVPAPGPLQTIDKIYKSGVTTDGTGAPNVSNVSKFHISWSLENKGLYQFSLEYVATPNYLNFQPTNTFDKPGPTFTLSGSQVNGLDGEYYIKADATQCVWVRKDGKFAVIFKY